MSKMEAQLLFLASISQLVLEEVDKQVFDEYLNGITNKNIWLKR